MPFSRYCVALITNILLLLHIFRKVKKTNFWNYYWWT